MAAGARWCFSRQQLRDSPSRRGGVDWDRELSYRQQAANLVQDMGQRLSVSQLTINTAIVYMHRFYMQQCFTKFHRNTIAPAALFLAAKVEEQPRKLEHVIKVAHACLNPQGPAPDTKSEVYLQEAQDLVILESVILQTLGFEITIDHPHTHVVKCTQLVRASKDLAQTSYFMATNSLHLTTFCLQYQPPVVACVCIHLACKWSNWEIPVSNDGKNWWEYVDGTVTRQLLDELTHEFLQILEKTPNRLKRIKNWRACQASKKPRVDGVEAEEGPGLGSGGLPPSLSLSADPPVWGEGLVGEGEGAGEGEGGGEGGGEGKGERGAGVKKGVPLRMTLSHYRAKRAEGLSWQRPPRAGGERRARPPEKGEEGGGSRKGVTVARERRKDGVHRHKHRHWVKRGEGEGRRKTPHPIPLPLLLPPSSPLPAAPLYPDTNGHSHYKDAFEMLESLLSAQGVPRGPGGGRRGRGGEQGPRQPPPLPSEPPPPLPPLPE